ncbi:MAG: S8 family serine peptidase [Ilumatobacteraceae bacterium]
MTTSRTFVRRVLGVSVVSAVCALGFVSPVRAATNDTYNSQQWGLSSTGAMAVWSTTRGAGVTVAIVDSGSGPHPDLDANVDVGLGISGGVESPDYADVDNEGHGTHVSGIVAALADNSLGIAGVAPAARILPIRVLDSNGSGDSRDVARGIRYAADRGARVINLSLGGVFESPVVTQAIDYATSKGALVIAAAGNGGSLSSPKWPANYDGTIAVTAIDPDDQSPAFAQRGDYIDISAPGVRIVSTAQGEYNTQSGTSMSAAFVSGAAALLFSARPQLTPAEVRDMLILSAIDIGSPGRDSTYGAGRLNIPGAFALLAARYPSTSTISIDGPARVKAMLTALSTGATTNLQWYRCKQIGTDTDAVPNDCVAIAGANGSTYKLTPTDLRSSIRVGATIDGQPRISGTVGEVVAIWPRGTTLTVSKPAKIATLVGSPSTGKRSIRLVSGSCSIRNLTVVAFAPGTCRIKVSIAAKKPYPALAITFDVSTN